MGWASFAAQLLTGFLGAPPTRYDKAFAKVLGVTANDIHDFINYEKNLENMANIPRTCTEPELLVHCVCAKKIIDKYRGAAGDVQALWVLCNELIGVSLHNGREYKYKCLTFDKGRIMLPSGLSLRYPQLYQHVVNNKAQWLYGEHSKKLYGGKLVENIVQAVARCVMTDGMLRIQERYRCVLTVHDEAVVLVPEQEAEEAEPWVLAQMTADPWYMPGIPLDAETGSAVRYGEAK